MSILNFPSPINTYQAPFGCDSWTLHVKRDDLIHPIMSGNKARKLYALMQLKSEVAPKSIASMGGPYSNHLHALGFWCHYRGIRFHAIIRGQRPSVLSETLKDIEDWGGQLHFVSRADFRRLREDRKLVTTFIEGFAEHWIPEGGLSAQAVDDFGKALDEFIFVPDIIYVPVGTGASFLGLCRGVLDRKWPTQVVGVVVSKGTENSLSLTSDNTNNIDLSWQKVGQLRHEFAGNGFAKMDASLVSRLLRYEALLSLCLEPIYLVKTIDAIFTDAAAGRFVNKNVVLWHTGGLQGRRSNQFARYLANLEQKSLARR